MLVAGALLAAMIAGAFPSACVTRLPGDQNALQQIEDLARNVDDGGARRP